MKTLGMIIVMIPIITASIKFGINPRGNIVKMSAIKNSINAIA